MPASANGELPLLAGIYRKALFARRFEERLLKLSMQGVLPPLLHPGAGQEVAQLAALAALNDDDPLLYSHRGVAYMLGRGVSPRVILADMLGREGGTNNGKGGVMHIVDVGRGVYGQSGTLGGGFVISVGMGMAIKHTSSSKIVAHFFGDGTANRGTFHESLNWASIQKLPCIYICENNGWAVSVPVVESTAVEDIAVRATGYGIPGVIVNGFAPGDVYSAVLKAAERARSGMGPTLIEVKVPRLLGHYATDPQDYRDEQPASQGDPLIVLREQLIAGAAFSPDELDRLEQKVSAQIDSALEEAQGSPEIPSTAAFEDLFA